MVKACLNKSNTVTGDVNVELTGNIMMSHKDGMPSEKEAHGMFSDYLTDDKIASNRGSVSNSVGTFGAENQL